MSKCSFCNKEWDQTDNIFTFDGVDEEQDVVQRLHFCMQCFVNYSHEAFVKDFVNRHTKCASTSCCSLCSKECYKSWQVAITYWTKDLAYNRTVCVKCFEKTFGKDILKKLGILTPEVNVG